MKTRYLLAAATAALWLGASAHAAPAYNGTVKGVVDGKPIDVQVVCERIKTPKAERIRVMSDPGMDMSAVDRNGDGIAVTVGGVPASGQVGFEVLVDGKLYRFGTLKGEKLKVTPTGLSIKDTFSGIDKSTKARISYDANLTVTCP